MISGIRLEQFLNLFMLDKGVWWSFDLEVRGSTGMSLFDSRLDIDGQDETCLQTLLDNLDEELLAREVVGVRAVTVRVVDDNRFEEYDTMHPRNSRAIPGLIMVVGGCIKNNKYGRDVGHGLIGQIKQPSIMEVILWQNLLCL